MDSGKWEEREQECKTEEVTHRMFQHRNFSLMALEICFPVSNKMEQLLPQNPVMSILAIHSHPKWMHNFTRTPKIIFIASQICSDHNPDSHLEEKG